LRRGKQPGLKHGDALYFAPVFALLVTVGKLLPSSRVVTILIPAQLANVEDDAMLQARGITYVPDFVANRMYVAAERPAFPC
jgi:hypothetical protein